MCGPEDAGELKSFEARLASLEPRDDRLNRDRLMFLAGQASVGSVERRLVGDNLRWHAPRDGRTDVLTVGDGTTGDIDGRISRLLASKGTATAILEPERAVFTPTSWRLVFGAPYSETDSSSTPHFWRTRA